MRKRAKMSVLFFFNIKREGNPGDTAQAAEVKTCSVNWTNLNPNQANIWLVRTSVVELYDLFPF